jgi:hypothetical protein
MLVKAYTDGSGSVLRRHAELHRLMRYWRVRFRGESAPAASAWESSVRRLPFVTQRSNRNDPESGAEASGLRRAGRRAGTDRRVFPVPRSRASVYCLSRLCETSNTRRLWRLTLAGEPRRYAEHSHLDLGESSASPEEPWVLEHRSFPDSVAGSSVRMHRFSRQAPSNHCCQDVAPRVCTMTNCSPLGDTSYIVFAPT